MWTSFRLTWWVPLVQQELLSLTEHLNSSPVFSEVCVTRSLVLCVKFCRSLFVLLYFFFWPLCCLSFFDLRFWLPFWYLQTLLSIDHLFLGSNISYSQGWIRDLWLGGGVSRRGVWGPHKVGVGGPGGQSPPEALGVWRITDIYLNDNFEPTTPFLSDQNNLTHRGIRIRIFIIPINARPTIGANKLHTLIIVIGGNYTYIIYKYNVSCRVQSLE